ncbi:MAG: UDP-N-acetylmuramate--L-alanine ligase [Planctomycetes bacterium]|nr:UDP-N-acetylmuramate--L-alanine ligase [Planctomycetota bacterium]
MIIDSVTPWFSSQRSLAERRIWLVGAGGTGVSGLARLLKRRGAQVRGSDHEASPAVQSLRSEGFDISIGTAMDIPADTELVIATAAAKPDHPQLVAAAKRGIPVRTYAEALGLVQLGHTAVCVAGTHGKSTTTCLLTWCLLQAGFDPGFIAGATCKALGGSMRTGAATQKTGPFAGSLGFLVTESCEFDRSFHKLHPTAAIINNVEADHLDCYASLEEIIESFRVFALRLPAAADHGYLLIAHEGAHRERIAKDLRAECETFGLHASADHVVEWSAEGMVRVTRSGKETLRWIPKLLGAHNALNGAAAGIMALRLGADRGSVEQALASFAGVDRRLEFLGERMDGTASVRVFDDYGHHPTEVRVTLEALRHAAKPRKLICLFQPHQHSRTRLLLDDFGTCFGAADHVLLTDIHFVRDAESERSLVSSEDVAKRIRDHGGSAECVGTIERGAEKLREIARGGDVVVTMGAGPIYRAAHLYLKA